MLNDKNIKKVFLFSIFIFLSLIITFNIIIFFIDKNKINFIDMEFQKIEINNQNNFLLKKFLNFDKNNESCKIFKTKIEKINEKENNIFLKINSYSKNFLFFFQNNKKLYEEKLITEYFNNYLNINFFNENCENYFFTILFIVDDKKINNNIQKLILEEFDKKYKDKKDLNIQIFIKNKDNGFHINKLKNYLNLKKNQILINNIIYNETIYLSEINGLYIKK